MGQKSPGVDISYIRTGEGFDYLCQIRDVYTNTVLASCQTENMKKELVLKTLNEYVGVVLHPRAGRVYSSGGGN